MITLGCYAVTVAILAIQVGATATYSELMPPGRKGVPAVVDQLPAARILNAVNAELTLPLLGRDYRHYVTTYFRSPLPEDVIESKAEYVLLMRQQEADYSRVLTLSAVATDSSIVYGGITLWKVNRTGQLKTSERILQSSPYPVMTSPKYPSTLVPPVTSR
ncbi:MAG: hypothetical protein WEE89_07975 [Gemmatimonadota bacterium]